jgi:hypothetical protein
MAYELDNDGFCAAVREARVASPVVLTHRMPGERAVRLGKGTLREALRDAGHPRLGEGRLGLEVATATGETLTLVRRHGMLVLSDE